MKDSKENKIMWQIYRELYRASTPNADFDQLVKNAEINEQGQKIIDFMAYEILQKDYEEIVERNIKGKRLTKLTQQMIKNSVALGASPKFKKE